MILDKGKERCCMRSIQGTSSKTLKQSHYAQTNIGTVRNVIRSSAVWQAPCELRAIPAKAASESSIMPPKRPPTDKAIWIKNAIAYLGRADRPDGEAKLGPAAAGREAQRVWLGLAKDVKLIEAATVRSALNANANGRIPYLAGVVAGAAAAPAGDEDDGAPGRAPPASPSPPPADDGALGRAPPENTPLTSAAPAAAPAPAPGVPVMFNTAAKETRNGTGLSDISEYPPGRRWVHGRELGRGGNGVVYIWLQVDDANNITERIVVKDCYLNVETYKSLDRWHGNVRNLNAREHIEIACMRLLNDLGAESVDVMVKLVHSRVDHARLFHRMYMGFCAHGDLDGYSRSMSRMRWRGVRR